MKLNKFLVIIITICSCLIISCSTESNLDLPATNELKDLSQEKSTDYVKSSSQIVPGQYIVTLKSGTLQKPNIKTANMDYKQSVQSLKKEIPLKFSSIKEKDIKATFGYALQGFVATLTNEQVIDLRKDNRVLAIENDYIISLGLPTQKGKPKGGGGGPNQDPTQEIPWGIQRVGGPTDGSGKIAWVLDTGVDLHHKDLNVYRKGCTTFINNGYDVYSAQDENGHGTHVAGTIAALDNSIGVVGVAAGAKIAAVKVLDMQGSGHVYFTVQGLDYVAANASPGDAVNMSLGPGGRSISGYLDEAVQNLASMGVNVAIAAGNFYDDCSFYSPARNNGPNIYTVSAMDINDEIAYFSNYGEPVDFAAPGVDVKSTWVGGGYNTISGTSMATPHVCGLLLLGNVNSDGLVNGDPDGSPDLIAHN